MTRGPRPGALGHRVSACAAALLCAGALLLPGPAAARVAPESSPRPAARPLIPAVGPAETATPASAAAGEATRPRARPSATGAAQAEVAERPSVSAGLFNASDATLRFRAASPRPEQRPLDADSFKLAAAVRSQPGTEAITGRAGRICGNPALVGKPIPPIRERVRSCGLENGVEVTQVSGIALSQPLRVDCRTADTFASWVERSIVPAIGGTGGGVKRIEIAGSYVCRPRNNQSGSKTSEHGKGHAVDVSGFTLRDGQVITVKSGWGDRRTGRMLVAMHRDACGPFATVLGPGSDGFHEDHIHVDTAQRSRGGAYCR